MGNDVRGFVPYLVMVVVVAVVAVISLTLNQTSQGTSLQGAQVGYIVNSEEDRVELCSDSDEDGDIYTRGSVQVGIIERADFCNEDVVHQWYCRNVDLAVE